MIKQFTLPINKREIFPWDNIPHDLATLLGDNFIENTRNNVTIKMDKGKLYSNLGDNELHCDKLLNVEDNIYSTNIAQETPRNIINKSLNQHSLYSIEDEQIDGLSSRDTGNRIKPSLMELITTDLPCLDQYLEEFKHLFQPENTFDTVTDLHKIDRNCLAVQDNNLKSDKSQDTLVIDDIEAPLYQQLHPITKKTKKTSNKLVKKRNYRKRKSDLQNEKTRKETVTKEEEKQRIVNTENTKLEISGLNEKTTEFVSNIDAMGKGLSGEGEITSIQSFTALWGSRVTPKGETDTLAANDVDSLIDNLHMYNDIESKMFLKPTTSNHCVDKDAMDESVDTILQSHLYDKNSSSLPNAFDLWTEKYRKLVEEEYPNSSERFINQKLTDIWCKIPNEHRTRYYQKAYELFQQFKQTTFGQFSYIDRSTKRTKNAAENIPKEDHPCITGMTSGESDILKVNKMDDILYQDTPKIHKPKARRGAEANSKEDEGQKVQFAEEQYEETGKFDYSKALKETTTYNSPVNKEMKKRLGKYRLHEDEVMDYSDETSLATGFLMDIMISSDKKDDEDNIEELTQSMVHTPPDIDKFSPVDITGLDNYLLGKEKCDLLDDLELQEQIEMQKEFDKKSNPKRKARSRRRKTGNKNTGTKARKNTNQSPSKS